jgi:Cys-rich repeat protein
MLKRLKIKGLMVIAGMMLVFTFGLIERAGAQQGPQACPTVPFSTGWISAPIVPILPPDFVAGLLGTFESSGGGVVGGLDWMYGAGGNPPSLNTTLTGSQLISWWSQKGGRNTTLQVTNTIDEGVAVHVQILGEDCVELRDFCDFYTGLDTHVYDFSDLVTNAGQDISEGILQGREGTVVVTPVADCVLGTFFPAIAFNFLQGNVAISDPNDVEYGANVYARLADDTREAPICTTLTGDPGCSFQSIVPGALQKDFNVLPGSVAVGADLVVLQFADSYGVTYKAVPALSQIGEFIITDADENQESCTPTVACFTRIGVDEALPVSEDFTPPVPTPTPTPTPTPCTSDADCPEGFVCDTTGGVCVVVPTPTPTPTPGGGGGGGGGCAIAGPVGVGTAMANVLIPLVPVAFGFGVRMIRRRNRK